MKKWEKAWTKKYEEKITKYKWNYYNVDNT